MLVWYIKTSSLLICATTMARSHTASFIWKLKWIYENYQTDENLINLFAFIIINNSTWGILQHRMHYQKMENLSREMAFFIAHHHHYHQCGNGMYSCGKYNSYRTNSNSIPIRIVVKAAPPFRYYKLWMLIRSHFIPLLARSSRNRWQCFFCSLLFLCSWNDLIIII